jgi:hypothetical protein
MKLSDVEVLIAQQRDISRRLDQLVFENAYDQGPNADAILDAYEQSQRSTDMLIALAKKLV